MRAPIGTSHANLVEHEKGEGGDVSRGAEGDLEDFWGLLRRRSQAPEISARMGKTSGVQTSFASVSDDAQEDSSCHGEDTVAWAVRGTADAMLAEIPRRTGSDVGACRWAPA